MNPHSRTPHEELDTLCGIARDGELTPQQFARLEEILAENPHAREHYVQFFQLHAWLTRQEFELEKPIRGDSPDLLVSGLASEGSPVDLQAVHSSRSGRPGMKVVSALWLNYGPVLTVAALLFLMFGFWSSRREVQELRSRVARESAEGHGELPVAYLTLANGCAWGDGDLPVVRKVGTAIGVGDELTLHEGIAEFRLENGVRMSIEGPASIVLSSPNSMLLQYGKLTTHVPRHASEFKILAAACRLVTHDGECGVALSGDRLDVHVFSGEVRVINTLVATDFGDLLLNEGGSVVADDDGFFAKAIITAGRSLALMSEGDALKVEGWGKVVPSMFATKLSASGNLPVTEEYVNAVNELKPVGYWRFESLEAGVAKNEIPSGINLRLVGDMKLEGSPQNRVLQSGHNLTHSYLIGDKPFDAISGTDYSIEFWMKPSHFHRGGVVTLLQSPEVERGQHAMLIEAFGSFGSFQARNPNRIRFLHRDPPGAELSVGTSCFSRRPYLARRWQHVVATKRSDFMRLFVNGKLVAKEPDSTYLASDLSLVVGCTAGFDEDRHFFGEIDELAVYDFAITEADILRHYESIHWTSKQEADDSI